MLSRRIPAGTARSNATRQSRERALLQVEISAELENMPRYMAPRVWPLEERSLNLWGPSWMRE